MFFVDPTIPVVRAAVVEGRTNLASVAVCVCFRPSVQADLGRAVGVLHKITQQRTKDEKLGAISFTFPGSRNTSPVLNALDSIHDTQCWIVSVQTANQAYIKERIIGASKRGSNRYTCKQVEPGFKGTW